VFSKHFTGQGVGAIEKPAKLPWPVFLETLFNRCDPHGGQGIGLRYLTLS
jgi:hypothetical protein